METFYYLAMIATLISAFAMTKQIFIVDNIKTYRIQSMILLAINFAMLISNYKIHLLVSAFIILAFKIVFLPNFLFRVIKKLDIEEHFENLLNVQVLFLILGISTAACFELFPKEILHTMNPILSHALPISFSLVLIGLILMINRRKSLSQILGFLVVENGITLLVLFAQKDQSTVLELALALDLLIGIIVMSLFANKIKVSYEELESQ
jgi:hydrogenase-4 component E